MRIEPITKERLYEIAQANAFINIVVVDLVDGAMYADAFLDYDDVNDRLIVIIDSDDDGHRFVEEYMETWAAYEIMI